MERMKAEIIGVGTELLLGQIVNTNARFISEKLAEIGIDVLYHTVVGDNPARLVSVIETAQSRANLIIFTGGLGPTKDDLTKETISRCVGKPLVEDTKAMQYIEAYFERRGIPMTENNRKQALVLSASNVLPNDQGMAPGMAVKHEGICYILLPGPPREMVPMFENYAVPFLLSLISDSHIVHSKVLRFFGIGESALEEQLMDLIDSQSNPTIAPLAKDSEVTLRITAKAKNLPEAIAMITGVEAKIEERVGEFIYGYDLDSLPSVLVDQLEKRKLSFALAESCTGGLASRMVTGVPGCSSVYQGGVVCYTKLVKQRVLGVPSVILEQHGAVSEESARAMASQVRELMSASLGIAITGVAGPESAEGKPVGLVYIGLSSAEAEKVFEVKLSGTRDMIQARAAKYALFYALQELKA
jgi:nicotinamide-nucleotide amidase